jgi:hypothetical protein
MRKILIGGGVAVTLIIGAAVFLFSSLDTIVKKIIEEAGSQVAGVKVSVGGVKISLADGKAQITGLRVANPAGFKTDTAFELGEVAVALDTGSIGKNPFVVKDVLIGGPAVTYELGAGGTNLDQLQKNVKAFSAKSGGGSKEAAKPADKEEAKKMVIDRLAITGGQVKLAAAGMDSTAKLGDITLTGIGRDSGGASAAQVAEKLLDALVNGAVKSSAGFQGLLSGATDKAKALIPGDAGNAVKGLFGK